MTPVSIYDRLFKAILERVKELPNIWAKMGEGEQQRFLSRFDDVVRAALSEIVVEVAASDHEHILLALNEATVKGNVIKLKLGTGVMDDDTFKQLMLRVRASDHAVLVLCDMSQIKGKPPRPDPQQKDLLTNAGKAGTDAATEVMPADVADKIGAALEIIEQAGWENIARFNLQALSEEDLAECVAYAQAQMNPETVLPDMPKFFEGRNWKDPAENAPADS